MRLSDIEGTDEDRINKIPIRLLNYVISQLNYGSQISRYHDNTVTLDLVHEVMNELTVIKGENFNMAGLSEM